jgi:hypothetical protein
LWWTAALLLLVVAVEEDGAVVLRLPVAFATAGAGAEAEAEAEVLAWSESEANTSVTKLLPSFARRFFVDLDRRGMPNAEATGPRMPVALGMAFVNR